MESAKISRQYFSKRQLPSIQFSLPAEVTRYERFFALKYIIHLVEMFHFKFYLSDKLYDLAHIFVLLFVTISFVNGEDTNTNGVSSTSSEDCKVIPALHLLTYDGCIPKPIASFACKGRCSSYLQVSGSKLWQMERSCMCCQESGEREATVTLFCPKAKQGEKKFRKVTTKAPLECMCRPCTSIEESSVVPQEMLNFPNEQPINGHFVTSE